MTSFFNASPQYDMPPDVKAVLVIIHGMAEHSARYDQVTAFLNARGIGCCRFDLRGHGKVPRSDAERGDVVAFTDLVTDAAAVVEGVRARYPATPVFVWGHSMGAIVAVQTAATMQGSGPAKIRGMITSSPPIAAFDAVPSFVLRVLKWLVAVMPRFRVALPVKSERLSRDPTVGQRYIADPLVPKTVTLRLLVQLAQASSECLRVARKLKMPWLAMHGTSDEVAPPIGSQRLFDALQSADKHLRLWPDARHEVHNEIEPTRTEFLECMAAWVKERA